MEKQGQVNAYDAIQAMAARFTPELAFVGHSQADFFSWRARALSAYYRSIGPWPEPTDPHLEIVEEAELEDHRRLHLYFDSSPGVRVPAYLLLPSDLREGERRPGILAAHGHGNGKDDVAGVKQNQEEATTPSADLNYSYGLEAVRRGYVVIAPDWLPFGERRPPIDWARPSRDPCNVVGMAWQYFGYTLLAQNIWDGMRAVDVLASRPEVDPERLGVLGLSYGGTMTAHLAINDPRLKVAIISGYLSTVRGDAITMRGKGNFCGAQHLPGLLRYGDLPELIGLIAPKPLLIEAGRRDDCFVIEDVRQAFARLERIYRAAGCSDRLAYEEHDGAHRWHGVMAWQWLERWL